MYVPNEPITDPLEDSKTGTHVKDHTQNLLVQIRTTNGPNIKSVTTWIATVFSYHRNFHLQPIYIEDSIHENCWRLLQEVKMIEILRAIRNPRIA